MARFTTKDCEEYTRILANRLGLPYGSREEGGIWCDYAASYGGAVICQNRGGGAHRMFGNERRKPAVFCAAVGLAIDAIEFVERRKEEESKKEESHEELRISA